MQIKRHSADKQAFCKADANYLDVSSPIYFLRYWRSAQQMRSKYFFFMQFQ